MKIHQMTFKIKGYLSILFIFAVIFGCKGQQQYRGINSTTGIPYSTTETMEQLTGSDTKANDAMTAWRERTASSSSEAPPDLATIRCAGINGFPDISGIANFSTREKAFRESQGGPGCRCIPMGDLCSPRTCHCKEICPNDHGIFMSQAHQMEPSMSNQFAFLNSSFYNSSVFRSHPLTGGFCTGMSVQRRKFASLAMFKPYHISRPALTVGTPAWEDYILTQIESMSGGATPDLVGAGNLKELASKSARVREALIRVLGPSSVEDYAEGKVDGSTYYFITADGRDVSTKLSFPQPTGNSVPARVQRDTDINPATGQAFGPIPRQNSAEYISYIQKKVEMVCQGFPAVIPGVNNLGELSSNPAYQEILGRYAAIDWQHVNAMDGEFGARSTYRGPFHKGNPDGEYNKMTRSEIDLQLEQLSQRLPVIGANDIKQNSWNRQGPWQTVPIEFKRTIPQPSSTPKETPPQKNPPPPDSNGLKNQISGSGGGGETGPGADDNHSYHEVEAYAVVNQSDGSKKICVMDPNYDGIQNEYCSSHFIIPAPGSSDNVVYNRSPLQTMGKFAMTPSSGHYQGLMTTRMVEYCRTKNANNFAVNDCTN